MAYVIKGMVQRNTVWDDNKKAMVEVEPYLVNACGSDYTMIIQDLKTLRGVHNRIKNIKWRKDVVEVHICTSVNVTNDNLDRLVERLSEGQFQKAGI